MLVSKSGNCVESLLIGTDPQNVGMIGFCHAERPHRLEFAVSLHQGSQRWFGLDGLEQDAGLGLYFGLWLPAILRNAGRGAGNSEKMVGKGKNLR